MSYQIDNYSFKGKRVLVRVDFNVPLSDALEVTDDTRIRAAVRTIARIADEGGRVILMSHLGRPKGGPEDRFSLRHIVSTVSACLGRPVKFADDCIGARARAVTDALKNGEVCLLENLRFYKEEEAGDEFFAGQLAENGDVFVNDAFGTAHRAHASTAIVARFFPTDKLFGYLMEDEVKNIERVLYSSATPVTAIIGGSKVSSKIAILENLMDRVQNILVGGGMAFTFIKAQGGKVGNSLVEEELTGKAIELIAMARDKGVNFYLPTDAIAADAFSNDAQRKECSIASIPKGWMGLDIGPRTINLYREVILSSKTILWNGPMGVFEMAHFAEGTLAVAQALADATERHRAFTLIGGGDSVAALNQFGLMAKVSYVSTGGGAMLESLEGEALPGVSAITDKV